MRYRLFAFSVLAAAILVSLSLIAAQDRPYVPGAPPPPPTQPAPPIIQTSGTSTPGVFPPAPTPVAPAPLSPSATRDFTNLTAAQKQVLLSCRRGAEFLYNTKRLDGRFRYGYVPSLGRDLEGDNYLRQVGAALALARAARLTGEKRYDLVATQAILALLDETTVDDPKNPKERTTTLPASLVNPLGSAGLLVLAINELPAPKADLLDKSEQLCNFIRTKARPDGAVDCVCFPDGNGPVSPEVDQFTKEYAGEALTALMVSQRYRPAAWKTDVVRKAIPHYRHWWQDHNKNPTFVAWQSVAYAEAYLATKEQVFADFVYEMNDYNCDQQYTQPDPSHPEWRGGFRDVHDRWGDVAPQIDSAVYAEGLAAACWVARQAGDVKRFERYSTAAGDCVHFLTLLQYTEGNTSHFEESYRKRLLGGFFASHQDGNLRLDYTQHALSAMADYVEHVAK